MKIVKFYRKQSFKMFELACIVFKIAIQKLMVKPFKRDFSLKLEMSFFTEAIIPS